MYRFVARVAAWCIFKIQYVSIRARSTYWKLLIESRGGTVGNGFEIRKNAHIHLPQGSSLKIGANVTIAEGAFVAIGHNGSLVIDEGVFISRYSTVVANQEVTIGARTQVAHLATIIDSNHKHSDPTTPMLEQGIDCAPIRIGSDVWVGTGAAVLKGVTLHNHSVVGANAVVTRDVEAYKVVVGVPAKPLGA